MEGIKKGDWVLYRINSKFPLDEWAAGIFVREDKDDYYIIGNRLRGKEDWEIIPYEGNESILGTTSNTWKPELGNVVAFGDGSGTWTVGIYRGVRNDGAYICQKDTRNACFKYYLQCEPVEKHFEVCRANKTGMREGD